MRERRDQSRLPSDGTADEREHDDRRRERDEPVVLDRVLASLFADESIRTDVVQAEPPTLRAPATAAPRLGTGAKTPPVQCVQMRRGAGVSTGARHRKSRATDWHAVNRGSIGLLASGESASRPR